MTMHHLPTAYPNPRYYRRHSFSKSIKQTMKGLHNLDNFHGPYQVAEDWLWISLAILGASLSWQTLPPVLAGLIYFAAVIVIGARQRGLRVNNHQATHKALAKNSTLNWVLATLFCAWPVLESFTGFDDTHNSREHGHHFNLGTANDVDHMAVVRTGLYAPEIASHQVKQFLWQIPLTTPLYLYFLLTNRIFNPYEDARERVIRLFYFAGIASLLVYFGLGQWFLLYWVVPLFTTANWIGAFIQLAEHYPLIATAEPVDIYLSRNRILPCYWNALFSVHQEGYHLIHHLYPRLPLWNMRKAHAVLMQDPDYAALHTEPGMGFLIQALTTHTGKTFFRHAAMLAGSTLS